MVEIGGKDINVATTIQQPTTITPDRYYPGDDMEAIQPKTAEQLAALAGEQQRGNLETAIRLAQGIKRKLQETLDLPVEAQSPERSQDLETDSA